MILSNFAERLSELLFDEKLNAPAFAKRIGCGRSTVNSYLSGSKIPSVSMLVKMADFFHCSTDYLLGRIQEEHAVVFKQCPPFRERLPVLLGSVTKAELQRRTNLPESAIYNWQRGQTQPSVESVVRIAEALDCSVDYVLGRES